MTKKNQSIRLLWPALRPWRGGFLIAVLFLAGEAVCDLMMPTLMAHIVDKGVAAGSQSMVLHYLGLMLLVTGLGAAAAVGRNIVSSRVSFRFGRDLRRMIYQKVQGMPFESLDALGTGSLINRLTLDVSQVQQFVNGLMRIFVKAPMVGLGSMIMAISLKPSLAPIILIVVPVVTVIIVRSMRVGYPRFLVLQKRLDELGSRLREYLTAVRVVKAFNRAGFETERYRQVNEDAAGAAASASVAMARFSPMISLTVNGGILALLWLGALKIQNGGMEVGKVIAFFNYMTQILTSMLMISNVFNMFVRASASASRLSQVLGAEGSLPEESRRQSNWPETGSLVFDRVTLLYPSGSDIPALKDISFRVAPGETLGVIGATGSGKSSLVQLMAGFYPATQGSVLVHGVPVHEDHIHELRQTMAFVPQKSLLFTGTILENIRWGLENATMEEVETACRTAGAHEFVASFPEGYHTRLGQGGVNLSGGQKQRLAIARALIRKPDILILDDCTSSVDALTEARIRENIRQESRGLTTLLIAQRVTSVISADRILVLDDGMIAGVGTHRELMASSSVYQEIVMSQIGREALHHAHA